MLQFRWFQVESPLLTVSSFSNYYTHERIQYPTCTEVNKPRIMKVSLPLRHNNSTLESLACSHQSFILIRHIRVSFTLATSGFHSLATSGFHSHWPHQGFVHTGHIRVSFTLATSGFHSHWPHQGFIHTGHIRVSLMAVKSKHIIPVFWLLLLHL